MLRTVLYVSPLWSYRAVSGASQWSVPAPLDAGVAPASPDADALVGATTGGRMSIPKRKLSWSALASSHWLKMLSLNEGA